MKNLFKLIYLSIALSALFGCEKEENGTAQNENFKTVSVDDAIGFLNLRTVKKTNANSYLTNISTDVQQEQITNTDELLTIVPAATIHQQHYSRILLLEIDGEIQSVVFSMTPDESPDSEAYDGELLITDLDGSFIKGYTVENGILQTEYLGFPDVYGKAVTQKNDCTDCPYSVCDFCDLEEVDLGFVGGSSGLPQVNYIVIGSIFDRGNSGGYIDFGWNSGGGGGGSSSPNITPYQGFLNSLTLAQRNFLTANTPLKINIQNFFSENGHSEATESFVTDIIIYLMGNPNSSLEFNINLDPNNALHFDSFEEAEDYFDSLSSSNYTHISSVFEIGSVRRDVHSLEFNNFPQANIVTSIKAMIPDDNNALECLNILNVRSELEGNNTLFDWTQLDSEDPNDSSGPVIEINESTDSVKISVEGEMLVGLNIGGYPLRSRHLITVVITYNYSTAQINEDYCYWYYTN